MTMYRGGGNNIPLTNTQGVQKGCSEKSLKPQDFNPNNLISPIGETQKRVVFDWVSYTFDSLDYDSYFEETLGQVVVVPSFNENNDEIMSNLFRILGSTDNWREVPMKDSKVANFKGCFTIGEFIQINLAGPKSARDRRTTQVLLTGSACKELVEHQRLDNPDGVWVELFSFLASLGGQFKRVDLAIDDFSGKEQDIYDLRSPAEKGHWVGSFQQMVVYYGISYRGGISSKGYSLTFGSPTSNQLQIYDKNLERIAKDQETLHTDKWYRYEMRIVEPKAGMLVTGYLNTMLDPDNQNDSKRLSKFAMATLNSMIEFKTPCSKKNVSRDWKTMRSWKRFTQTVEKTDLHHESTAQKTIDRNREWFTRSLKRMMAKFYLAFGSTDFEKMGEDWIKQGLFEIDSQSLTAVNRKREELGLPQYTEEDVRLMAQRHSEPLPF